MTSVHLHACLEEKLSSGIMHCESCLFEERYLQNGNFQDRYRNFNTFIHVTFLSKFPTSNTASDVKPNTSQWIAALDACLASRGIW